MIMKRLYENVPVQTLLYVVNPLARVVITDYEDTYYKTNPVIMYDGILKDLSIVNKDWPLCSCDKVMKAAVRSIEIIGKDDIAISICTRREEY